MHVVSCVFNEATIVYHLLIEICFVFKSFIIRTAKRLSAERNHEFRIAKWVNLILESLLAIPLVLPWRRYSTPLVLLGVRACYGCLIISSDAFPGCCHCLNAVSHLRVLSLFTSGSSSLWLRSSCFLLLLLLLYLHLLYLLSYILLIRMQLRTLNESTKYDIWSDSKFKFRILLCILLLLLHLFSLRHWRIQTFVHILLKILFVVLIAL